MGTKKLLIAAIVLAALSGLLWWSNKHPDWGKDKKPDASANPVLLNVSDTALDSHRHSEKRRLQVKLERKNGKWTITAPASYPADQDAVSSVANALSPANGDSVVEEKPGDVAKYGLTNPTSPFPFTKKAAVPTNCSFGDDIPADLWSMCALAVIQKCSPRRRRSKRSFDKGLNDLRDKRLA
jgi:hypothetical protein